MTGRFPAADGRNPTHASPAEAVSEARRGTRGFAPETGWIVDRPMRPGTVRAIKDRCGSNWGIKMTGLRASRLTNRNVAFDHCRAFLSRSIALLAPLAGRVVLHDRGFTQTALCPQPAYARPSEPMRARCGRGR
jgi:hypothetical protein